MAITNKLPADTSTILSTAELEGLSVVVSVGEALVGTGIANIDGQLLG